MLDLAHMKHHGLKSEYGKQIQQQTQQTAQSRAGELLMQLEQGGWERYLTKGDGWRLTSVSRLIPTPAEESPAATVQANQPFAKGSPWVSVPEASDTHLPTTCHGGNKIPGDLAPK